MDAKTITDIIATLGFPVALVAAMSYFIFLMWKQSAKRETKLYEELAECRTVNKLAIETLAKYAERLGTIETDVKHIKDEIVTLNAKQNYYRKGETL